MKVIIAGSRSAGEYMNFLDVEKAVLQSGFVISEVVSGTARGADRLGEQFAESYRIPIKRFPAAWEVHGRSAGYIRNSEMANYADALIALWDYNSRGTKHMIDLARDKGIPVFVYNFFSKEGKRM